jgi:hypothetical protein
MRKSGRRHEPEEPFSLNSLLDTLMNVVGVSLILLAAAQLGLLDTQRELISSDIPADIGTRLEKEKKRSKEKPRVPESETSPLAGVRRGEKEEREALLARLKYLQRAPVRLQGILREFSQAQQSAKGMEDELASLTANIETLRDGVSNLAIEESKLKPATTIRLPVRRTLDRELKSVNFVCRNGRVYPLDYERLSNAFSGAWKASISKLTSSMTTIQRVRSVVSYFDDNDVGDPYFRLKLQAVVDGQKLSGFRISTLPRNAGQGETLAEARNSDSRFLGAVSSLNPKEQYVSFSVWADSFELYLELRKEAERIHSMSSGGQTQIGLSWTPYALDEQITEFMDLNQSSGQKGTSGVKSGTTIDN